MSFDPQSFLDASITDAMDTKIIPCPQGEFLAVIEKIAPRQWTSGDGTKAGIALDVTWMIDDQGVKDFLGRDTVTVKQQVFLDITDDGKLETGTGKNVGLGRLRDALGLNEPGKAFSFNMLPGQMAKVVVGHRNGKTAEDIFADITKVAKPN